mmetsp:Transcript_68356/g.189989  ORF Transcript_68356/g.189989 Transcript_68356/m.189989 type:complete len:240 (-) Transcript_68356:2709-3428(-)
MVSSVRVRLALLLVRVATTGELCVCVLLAVFPLRHDLLVCQHVHHGALDPILQTSRVLALELGAGVKILRPLPVKHDLTRVVQRERHGNSPPACYFSSEGRPASGQELGLEVKAPHHLHQHTDRHCAATGRAVSAVDPCKPPRLLGRVSGSAQPLRPLFHRELNHAPVRHSAAVGREVLLEPTEGIQGGLVTLLAEVEDIRHEGVAQVRGSAEVEAGCGAECHPMLSTREGRAIIPSPE